MKWYEWLVALAILGLIWVGLIWVWNPAPQIGTYQPFGPDGIRGWVSGNTTTIVALGVAYFAYIGFHENRRRAGLSLNEKVLSELYSPLYVLSLQGTAKVKESRQDIETIISENLHWLRDGARIEYSKILAGASGQAETEVLKAFCIEVESDWKVFHSALWDAIRDAPFPFQIRAAYVGRKEKIKGEKEAERRHGRV